jgi:hypothetical protein
MAKPPNKAPTQLELRLLSDLKARSGPGTSVGSFAQAKESGHDQAPPFKGRASETDMDVYRAISGNYFDSINKP